MRNHHSVSGANNVGNGGHSALDIEALGGSGHWLASPEERITAERDDYEHYFASRLLRGAESPIRGPAKATPR
ncbi:MAG TPA: hypothetical protein VLZ74_15560 [Methylocella sp.]|nr:hypothetical protein [Methylocella sp.]